MTKYPGALDDFSEAPLVDGRYRRTAIQQDLLLPEVVEAIQAELGVAPSGDYATVTARLFAADALILAAGTTADGALQKPVIPVAVTGVRSTDTVSILQQVLHVLEGLGLIDDQTSVPGGSTAGVLTFSGTATAEAGT